MPFINLQASTDISEEKEKKLKEKLGKAIEIFPGKSERWLMVSFSKNVHLWFSGTNDAPSAMVEVKLFGKADSDSFDNMTAELCSIINEELGIPKNRIYVKYEECSHWGWNGSNF